MKNVSSALTFAGVLTALVSVLTSFSSAQGVRINEFMANNDTIASPATVKADWIELYNTTSSSVSLAGMYLSDDAALPAKWQFPTGTTIAANGYLVVWAYDTTFAGALYATWALSKDGEHLRLSASNLTVIDSLTFGIQLKNRSMARVPNGTGGFSASCLPTLGMANSCVVTGLSGTRSPREGADLSLARAGGRMTATFTMKGPGRAYLAVLDAQGREVTVLADGSLPSGAHVRAVEAGALTAGTYWLVLRAEGRESMRSIVLLR